MELPRSGFHAASDPAAEDPLIGVVQSTTDTCRNYWYRRVTAELRHGGLVVNSKKVRRITRQNGLDPKRKRRDVVTTDSSHDRRYIPMSPRALKFMARTSSGLEASPMSPSRPVLSIWPSLLMHVRARWSGYGLGRNIDVRLTAAALKAAIASRHPLPGCVFHSGREAQYAASRHRRILEQHGFFGSMSRRGNPYDNAQAESFMKTLKVEAVCITEYEVFDDVAADCQTSPTASTTPPDCTRRSVISAPTSSKKGTPRPGQKE